MRLLAPAKINLYLRVGPPRADGFHSLLSWMTTVALFDTLILDGEPPPADSKLRAAIRAKDSGEGASATIPTGTAGESIAPVSLVCDLPHLPCDERNLVVKIANAWKGALGTERGVRATLQKRIPMGAGLGGGSSDAARALLGLNQLWESGRAANDLSAFAARFGSDLPFFFHGPSSVCRGRGELVQPVPKPQASWAVLVLPRLSMPTPEVYRKFDEMSLGCEQNLRDEPDWKNWSRLSSAQLLPLLINDLELPAFSIAPQLGALRERIENLLGRPVRMSGSGSSLFTLFDSAPAASEAAESIKRNSGETALAAEISPILMDDLNETFAIM
jgi:4-diphosphocytidyl-2-C-methyl-D-erythritol kinase